MLLAPGRISGVRRCAEVGAYPEHLQVGVLRASEKDRESVAPESSRVWSTGFGRAPPLPRAGEGDRGEGLGGSEVDPIRRR